MRLGVGLGLTSLRLGGGGSQTHVFLIAGQSNAEDTAAYDSNGLYPDGTFQWTQAGALEAVTTSYLDHPTSDGAGMGFAITFVEDYMAANPGVDVVLVPEASNGTRFTTGEWGAGNTLSNNAIAAVNACLAANEGFDFKGVLWLQGESDALLTGGNSSYRTSQFNQFQAFRDGITGASSTTPIIVGEMVPAFVAANDDRQHIQEWISQTDKRVPYCAVASSAGLTTPDNLHFDAASLRTLGSRFYTAYADVLANGYAPTALNTAPSSVTKAVFTEHMAFSGTTLTGFTTDLFGNASNSVVVGSPQRGTYGGYLINTGTTSNYVYTTLSEVNTTYPTGSHVSICYRKTNTDSTGLFVGSITIDDFVGAAIDGNNDTVTTFGTGNARAYRGRRGADLVRVDLQRSTTTRNQLFDNLYADTLVNDINSITIEDMRLTPNGGRCYWGRYVDGASVHLNAEHMGWAVCTDESQIDEVNDWLSWWGPTR